MNTRVGLGLLTVVLLSAHSALAYDAYNNFGPGDSYDPATRYSVTGGEYPPGFTPFNQAARFTSEATGTLAVIRMALHNEFHDPAGFNQVDVRLHDVDIAGNIGPIIAAFTRCCLTTSGPMDAPVTITSFDPDVNLISGHQYWIVVAPGDHSTDAGWNRSLTDAGRRAFSTNSGLSYTYLDGLLGAMRIEVIPEPAAFSALVIGIAILALSNRRTR